MKRGPSTGGSFLAAPRGLNLGLAAGCVKLSLNLLNNTRSASLFNTRVKRALSLGDSGLLFQMWNASKGETKAKMWNESKNVKRKQKFETEVEMLNESKSVKRKRKVSNECEPRNESYKSAVRIFQATRFTHPHASDIWTFLPSDSIGCSHLDPPCDRQSSYFVMSSVFGVTEVINIWVKLINQV
jgi:hypothetical protein